MCWRDTILATIHQAAIRATAGGGISVEDYELPDSPEAVQLDLFESPWPRDHPDRADG